VRRFAAAGILAVTMLSAKAVRSAEPQGAAKIQEWVLEHTRDGARSEFFIVLRERADLALAEQLPTKEAKGWFVYEALTETADRTQKPVRDWLDARGVPYRAFYIVNALLVTGGRDLALKLASRDDVERIEGNPVIHNDLPGPGVVEDMGEGPAAPAGSGVVNAPDTTEWNVSKVSAPGVWALGYQGQGIVVGGQDTGYRWTHAALKKKYRGWDDSTSTVDHNYNWHDAIHTGGGTCGPNSMQPCDDYGHGTHTMGTVLGDDGAGNQIGVAPQAKWIGCRNMNVGNGTPATYLECFQFFLAPTRLDGTGADPSRAPDLTTNSWTCPSSEGCSWSTLQAAVDAQKAAGIMTVVAAGNSGPSCNTVGDPPAMYASAYTVGATTSSDTMASFSSRGPAYGTNLVKPDIVAPGYRVRSAYYSSDTAYTLMDGTSMATPCVAGGVALLWSAQPCYRRQQDATQTLLGANALKLTSVTESCGGNYVVGPNNTWGYGRLDVLSAVNATSCPVPQETAPGTSAAAAMAWSDKGTLAWPMNLQATSYTLYRGIPTDLPKLLDSQVDSCRRYQGSASTAAVPEDPSAVAGRLYWYLVTGSNGNGEGSAGNATAGPRVVNASGTCP
jgi:serine protease AprX